MTLTIDESTRGGADEMTEAPPPETPARRSRARLASYVALGLGLVLLLVGSVSWWRAAHDDAIAYARMRDQVMVAAQQDIEVLNTLDYRSVDEGLARWRAVSAGTLNDQLKQVGKQDRSDLAAAKKVTSGRVVDAALVDLDARQHTATVIASVEITVRGESGEPTVKRNRFTADLLRTGGTWKLTSLEQVSVNIQ